MRGRSFRSARLLPLVLAALLPAGAAAGEGAAPAGASARPPAAITLRTGDHPGFGRVVFDPPERTSWRVEHTGEQVRVFFPGEAVMPGQRPPRNVRAIAATSGGVELSLPPGVSLRHWRMGKRLIIDVFDPAATTTAAAATPGRKPGPAGRQPGPQTASGAPSAPKPSASKASSTAADPVSAAAPSVATVPVPQAGASPATAEPAPGQPAPAVAEAPPARSMPAEDARPGVASGGTPPSGPTGPATDAAPVGKVLLPFTSGTGAAAFRRGDEAVLVFDERRPIDLASLQADPVFGTAEIRLLPTATVLRLRLSADHVVVLAPGAGGWMVGIAGGTDRGRPIRPEPDAAAGRLVLPLDAPGRAVAIPDTLTGGLLLVGTQRKVGQAFPTLRRTPEFMLLPTWQGVAVAAISDGLSLREMPRGFALTAASPQGALALTAVGADLTALADAAPLTRRFDLPPQSVPALQSRLRDALAAASAAPPARRSASRLTMAQAMIALGLGAEAQAVLTLAGSEDPRAVDNPDQIGLFAIASLLAGRLAEAEGLEDARLSGTDEVAFWRAVRMAMLREGAPEAASGLARTLPLLLAYPTPLQARLLPLVAETMVLGGETEAARRLVEARAEDRTLDLARAFLLEARDPPAALALLDRLAQSPDRRLRARAASRAVERRLAAGEITPSVAADALEKLLYAWRGDGMEAALRIRTAELRAQAGAPRAALTLLRESAEALPDRAEQVRPAMARIFAAALTDAGAPSMPPLELVAMIEDNADLMSAAPEGVELATRLADRLAALDLPRRAAPVLEKLVANAAPGPVRAELGGQLAANRLQIGDPAGALAALSATGAETLPAAVQESRTLTWARATAATGDVARAMAVLEGLDTPAAQELRLQMLEQAKDWKGATATLRTLVARSLPERGGLDEAQTRLLLRLASAAAQAGDETLLAQIRQRDTSRLPSGPTADMVRLLVAGPVQAPDDLARARAEAGLARGLLGVAGR